MANENKPSQSKDPFNPAKPAPTPQVSVPEPPPGNTRHDWEDRAMSYLIGRGWEKCGVTHRGEALWQDPLAFPKAKTEWKPSVNLPAVGGGTEVIMQVHTPRNSLPMTTEQAYWVQQSRDKAGEGLDAVIERKEKELEALKAQAAAEKEAKKKAKVA